MSKEATDDCTARRLPPPDVRRRLPARAGGGGQEYTGLDKYLGQGRQASASFVGSAGGGVPDHPDRRPRHRHGRRLLPVADDITPIWWNPAGLGFHAEATK